MAVWLVLVGCSRSISSYIVAQLRARWAAWPALIQHAPLHDPSAFLLSATLSTFAPLVVPES